MKEGEGGWQETALFMMSQKAETNEAKWYVVHTYSGYENKVKVNLEKTVENRGLQEMILEINVPTEEIIEVKNGKRKLKQEKIFHGYVMVKMIMNDETWYVVRNTRGVTGFVGPGSKPIPLSDKEVVSMGMERIPLKIDIAVGDSVRIVTGPLENFTGTVEEVHPERQKVRVSVSMFGRDTPVDLDFVQVKKF